MKTAAVDRNVRSRRSLSRNDRFTLSTFVGIPTLLQVVFLWGPTLITVALSFTYWNGINVSDI